jgi:hypothetical protein
VLRLPALRLLERAAAVLRRLGLGGIVDRARRLVLPRLGDFSEQVGEITLTGDVELHSHYVRELKESDRERASAELFSAAVREGSMVLDVGAHLGYFWPVSAGRPSSRSSRIRRRSVTCAATSRRTASPTECASSSRQQAIIAGRRRSFSAREGTSRRFTRAARAIGL